MDKRKGLIVLLGVLVVVLGLGVFISYSNDKAVEAEGGMKVFYPDRNVEYWLIKEVAAVEDVEGFVHKLIKDKDLMIPDNVKLNNCYVDNGTLYIDFDEKFLYNNGDYVGDKVVVINVYSIVNAVCLNEQFNVEDVVFMINGVRENTIGPLINYENFGPDALLSEI